MTETKEEGPGIKTAFLGKEAEAAIHAELQGYLEQKGLNTLFQRLIQDILLEKPENPVEFMIKYLCKNYADETTEVVRKMSAVSIKNTSAEIPENSIPDSDSEEEEEDDDFDEEAERKFQERASHKSNGRRISVSAQVLKPGSLDESKPVMFEKTEEEELQLMDLLKKNILCTHLKEQALKSIVNSFESVTYEKDVEVITQGEIKADHFFLLQEGSAEVFKDGNSVHSYSSGSTFGELALMYNAPRAATVKTKEKCKMWRLDQKVFKQILMGSAIEFRRKNSEFLSKVEILKEMQDSEREKLLDAVKVETFNKDERICVQGEAGNVFFIISEGEVSVSVNGEIIGKLTAGEYFGEIALLTNNPRQATITAETDKVEVLSVDRKAFRRLLGPLEDILKRNMKSYSQYVAGVSVSN